MPWIENKPKPNDLLAEIGALVRSQKSNFRAGIEKHYFWRESSGLSAGEPRLSDGSFGPGSARAFYAPASELSTNATSGVLYIDSTNSRFYLLTSDTTVLLGGRQTIVMGGASVATIASNARTLVQSGISTGITGDSTERIDFPTPYTGSAPFVEVQSGWSTGVLAYLTAMTAVNTSGISVHIEYVGGGANPGDGAILWRSVGTVAL